jgi:protein-tyrosine-phosphatase
MVTELLLQSRARVHAALGDPARLAIVDMLVLGDASPSEISRELGLATNLVAHHVKVLQEAGVLERTRSEGDQRRTYLRLRPDTLDMLGSPGLPTTTRVVFVCIHNSTRSQLAAALWARHTARPTASAGTIPAARVHPRAVRVARRHDLDLNSATPAHVSEVVGPEDFVIAVCDNAHESLTGAARPRLHWSVPDPARVDTDAAFEAAYTELAGRIERLAPTAIGADPS